MDFKEIVDFIPKEYQVLVAVLTAVVYYGFPRFQEWRSHKRYFDSRIKVLEYKKLLYEVESMKKQSALEDVADIGLKELAALADELRPNIEVMPPMKRFFAGWGGAVIAFTIYSIFYFSLVTTENASSFVLGALILSFFSGAPTVLYRTDKVYKSGLFGGGAGLMISMIIGILIR